MKITRRDALMSTLFGAGYVGLRALATGLPASLLLDPRGARRSADAAMPRRRRQGAVHHLPDVGLGRSDQRATCRARTTTAASCTARTTATLSHPSDAASGVTASTPVTSRSATAVQAALRGRRCRRRVLDRTAFWHLMTNTPVHPKEPRRAPAHGRDAHDEMLPSLLAKQLAPCLGTIQTQPITLGATSPSEGLTFGGQALPIIPPLALKATLTNSHGPRRADEPAAAARSDAERHRTTCYKDGATRPRRSAYIDSLVTSQQQVRNINQSCSSTLLGIIKDNSVASQITAAITLIQMKVTPVIAIHIPFGGDNHRDTGLATETTQTVTGVGAIAR